MSNMIGEVADEKKIESVLKAAFSSLPPEAGVRIKDIKMSADGTVSVQTEVQPIYPIDFMEFSVNLGADETWRGKKYLFDG